MRPCKPFVRPPNVRPSQGGGAGAPAPPHRLRAFEFRQRSLLDLRLHHFRSFTKVLTAYLDFYGLAHHLEHPSDTDRDRAFAAPLQPSTGPWIGS